MALGSIEWIDDPSYYPNGLLSACYGFSNDEYMEFVESFDEIYGRVKNSAEEIKGYEIGEVGVYFTEVYDAKLSDLGLASALVTEAIYTGSYGDADVEAINSAIEDSRIWLMGSELYGWGECEYGILMAYEYYIFRIENNGVATAFIAECYSEYEGGEGVSILVLQ